LSVSSPEAGLVAGATFLLSAAVAYAAKARQVNRAEESASSPPNVEPLDPGVDVGVLLVSEGDPLKYDGPATWALRFQVQGARGQPAPPDRQSGDLPRL